MNKTVEGMITGGAIAALVAVFFSSSVWKKGNITRLK
jgi:CDP-diglyceride synthetase